VIHLYVFFGATIGTAIVIGFQHLLPFLWGEGAFRLGYFGAAALSVQFLMQLAIVSLAVFSSSISHSLFVCLAIVIAPFVMTVGASFQFCFGTELFPAVYTKSWQWWLMARVTAVAFTAHFQDKMLEVARIRRATDDTGSIVWRFPDRFWISTQPKSAIAGIAHLFYKAPTATCRTAAGNARSIISGTWPEFTGAVSSRIASPTSLASVVAGCIFAAVYARTTIFRHLCSTMRSEMLQFYTSREVLSSYGAC